MISFSTLPAATSSSSNSANTPSTSSSPTTQSLPPPKQLLLDDDDAEDALGVSDEASRPTRLQWISIAVVLLSLVCRTVLPETMTVAIVAELFSTTVTSLASVSRAKAVTPVVPRDFRAHGDLWEDPLNSTASEFKGSTKIIWGYWNSYPDGFPYLCQKALESWRLRNPDWHIVMLNDDNFQQYVSVSDLPSTFYSLKVQHRSDIIRLAVLIRYGGVYMDASTLVYKGLDGIWDALADDNDNDDKLLITSLNQLPNVGLDMYNNGLLMTKGLHNPFLVEWRRRILYYSEAPALTQDDMKRHPAFSRVHQHWDDPSLGVLGAMVPYHSNLWILNDMIWHNEMNLSQHIVHLPKIRWGFYYHSLPHFFDQLKVMTSEQAQDNRDNPEFVEWSAVSLVMSIAKHLKHGFFDHPAIAQGVMENVHILKFTSHDMPLVDMGINKIGLNSSTVGRIVRAAFDLDEFPLQQATLGGALPAVLLRAEHDGSR